MHRHFWAYWALSAASCKHHVMTVFLRTCACEIVDSVAVLADLPSRVPLQKFPLWVCPLSSAAQRRGGGAGGWLRRLNFFHFHNQWATASWQATHTQNSARPVIIYKIKVVSARWRGELMVWRSFLWMFHLQVHSEPVAVTAHLYALLILGYSYGIYLFKNDFLQLKHHGLSVMQNTKTLSLDMTHVFN